MNAPGASIQDSAEQSGGVAILDYGSGNVQAIANVYRRAGVPHFLAREPHDLIEADRIILPGVGAFDRALEQLEESRLIPVFEQRVLEHGVPVLGICVGMQMLAESSAEGTREGLGWISGRVVGFDPVSVDGLPLPHMGWNQVSPARHHAVLLDSLERGSEFYFLHSYHFECAEADDVLATAKYGREFATIVQRANVFGVQFHPEKSHEAGVRLLQNFGRLA